MDSKKKILLVEDEENFGSLLQNYLRLSKYEVDWKKDGALGYSAFVQNDYDICILDVMMPNMDGYSLAEKIRAKNQKVPLVFLTAKNNKEDLLKGYKIGADDYLNKPFDIEVLLLKIKVLLSRSGEVKSSNEQNQYQIGKFSYCSITRQLKSKQSERKLSPKEGQLLHLLCQHKNEVVLREKALLSIWKEDSYFTTRSMDVYITKLRKYLSEDDIVRIENVHSSGYALYDKQM